LKATQKNDFDPYGSDINPRETGIERYGFSGKQFTAQEVSNPRPFGL
jgi:hypothetical protein